MIYQKYEEYDEDYYDYEEFRKVNTIKNPYTAEKEKFLKNFRELLTKKRGSIQDSIPKKQLNEKISYGGEKPDENGGLKIKPY